MIDASQLYWHCASCGDHQTAQPEHKHGDSKSCLCGLGMTKVMTLQESARIEQCIALGESP